MEFIDVISRNLTPSPVLVNPSLPNASSPEEAILAPPMLDDGF